MEDLINNNVLPEGISDPQLMANYPGPMGLNGVTHFGHQHAEAFAIMQYTPTYKDEAWRSVYVWNSRDGVTPFVIFVDGLEYQHTNMRRDRYAPHYRPAVGEYVFRDCTPEEAQMLAERRIERTKGTEFEPKSVEHRRQLIDAIMGDIVDRPLLAKVNGTYYHSEILAK